MFSFLARLFGKKSTPKSAGNRLVDSPPSPPRPSLNSPLDNKKPTLSSGKNTNLRLSSNDGPTRTSLNVKKSPTDSSVGKLDKTDITENQLSASEDIKSSGPLSLEKSSASEETKTTEEPIKHPPSVGESIQPHKKTVEVDPPNSLTGPNLSPISTDVPNSLNDEPASPYVSQSTDASKAEEKNQSKSKDSTELRTDGLSGERVSKLNKTQSDTFSDSNIPSFKSESNFTGESENITVAKHQASRFSQSKEKIIMENTVTKFCPASGIPKGGEIMQKVTVDGEEIDVSSKGYYFDRGELLRILQNKPSFISSLYNKLTGRGVETDRILDQTVDSISASTGVSERASRLQDELQTLTKQKANLHPTDPQWNELDLKEQKIRAELQSIGRQI